MVQKYKINMETRVRLGKIKVDNDDATNIFQIIEIFIDKALSKSSLKLFFLRQSPIKLVDQSNFIDIR